MGIVYGAHSFPRGQVWKEYLDSQDGQEIVFSKKS